MRWKRTRVTDKIERIVDEKGYYRTGRFVYFRQIPGGPLVRMNSGDYSDYMKSRGAEKDKTFWKYAQFQEATDDIL